MTALKKFGEIAIKCVQIALGIAPVFQQALPSLTGKIDKAVADLNVFSRIIMNAEVMGNMAGVKGPQKLQMATPVIAQEVLDWMNLMGYKAQDETLFREACQGYADATAKLWNSIHPSAVTAVDVTVGSQG